jgi:hypothetical protein
MSTRSGTKPAADRPTISDFHRVKLVFLAAAFVSFVLSVWLWFMVDREAGLFVGLWVPAIHSLGALVLTGERNTS